ncbi:MAG: protein-L-isoaspartate O-methyltransferase family protein, partial [Egibacteraceae bacterium]
MAAGRPPRDDHTLEGRSDGPHRGDLTTARRQRRPNRRGHLPRTTWPCGPSGGCGGNRGRPVAALLADLVSQTGQVTTIDIDPEVAAQARQTLDATGYGRVHVTTGDGALGAPDRAPYDRV